MITTSATLAISGVVCLLLLGLMIYKLTPREGKPPSAWLKTEFRATSVAMIVLILLLAGITLLAKGIF